MKHNFNFIFLVSDGGTKMLCMRDGNQSGAYPFLAQHFKKTFKQGYKIY